jgi:hypothetical protein
VTWVTASLKVAAGECLQGSCCSSTADDEVIAAAVALYWLVTNGFTDIVAAAAA